MRRPAGFFLLVLAATLWATPQAARKDPFVTGQPFTVDQLVEAAPVIFEGRLREAIQNRGVAFPATPVALERLRKAGVSAEVLDLIRRLAPAPLPPPPPPQEAPRSGPLTMQCSPAECEVFVNGVAYGATQGGSKVIQGLPPGKVFLDFKKEGYEGSQAAVVLQPGLPMGHSVRLTPTLATRENLGTEVFAALVEALGGDAGLREAGSIIAAGTAVLWDRAGSRTDWTLQARLQLPDRAFWEIRGAGLDWWVGLVGGQSRSGGSGKLRGSPVALEMERNIRQLLAFQPASLINRVRGAGMRFAVSGAAAGGSEPVVLRAESPTEAYSFTLGADRTPSRVVYEPASGLGAGLQVLYGDYRKAGTGRYPMTLTVRFSDASQHGMEIRLSSLQTNARLADKDFRK